MLAFGKAGISTIRFYGSINNLGVRQFCYRFSFGFSTGTGKGFNAFCFTGGSGGFFFRFTSVSFTFPKVAEGGYFLLGRCYSITIFAVTAFS